MSRHPYTYAADYVRHHGGAEVSRSQASAIISGISEALGMEKEALSVKLSEFYQENQTRLTDEAVTRAIAAMGGRGEAE